MARQKTNTKFYIYEGNGSNGSQFTLNIGDPYEVTFFCNSKSGAVVGNNKLVVINQAYTLNAYSIPVATDRLYPYQFTIRCNLNEIDSTIYSLQIDGQLKVIVTARYYVGSN